MANLDTSMLKPGDVVIVEMGIWIIRWLIIIQAFLTGKAKYKQSGHVIVMTHVDSEGRVWGIEGRPGGIGWADMTKRNGKWGLANVDQPKDLVQRSKIVETMKTLLGTKYDYDAYLQIALNTVGINTNWTDFNGDDVPSHFICSAVADYVYEDVGLVNPGGMKITRLTTPAEWGEFIEKREWELSLKQF
jgi:hypothetical protein